MSRYFAAPPEKVTLFGSGDTSGELDREQHMVQSPIEIKYSASLRGPCILRSGCVLLFHIYHWQNYHEMLWQRT